MGHNISALISRTPVSAEVTRRYHTEAVELEGGLTLVWMDICLTEHWAIELGDDARLELARSVRDTNHLLPNEHVIVRLAEEMTGRRGVRFAMVWTYYFGGMGDQAACVYEHGELLDTDGTINDALRQLGVQAQPGLDEFDTVGLGEPGCRHIPDHLLDRWGEYGH